MILTSRCSSITGRILYSDVWEYTSINEANPNAVQEGSAHWCDHASKWPILNIIEISPIVGYGGAAFRVCLAIIHMLGHSFAAIVFWDKEHLPHVVKGGAELLRGVVAIIPIIGFVFVLYIDTRGDGEDSYGCFLVKIYNPENEIDMHFSMNNPTVSRIGYITIPKK